jgi:hypothetical protein
MSNGAPRVLIYDIETAPDLGYTWRKWDTNILGFVEGWYILCFAWKWLGENKTHVCGLPDFADTYAEDQQNDVDVVAKLWELFDEADITVTHNGKVFDKGKVHARMIYHNMQPPTPHKEIDTLQVARKEFTFTSNSLKDLAEYLQLTEAKMDPGGFQTWLGCMAGDRKAWATMMKYNKQDVVVTEQLYLRFRPWINRHPNLALYGTKPDACPKCGATGSENMIGRGWQHNAVTKRQKFQCTSCGGYSLGRALEKTNVRYVPSTS